jgi:hypothetical protein
MRRTIPLVSRLLLPVVLVLLGTGCGSDSSSPTALAGEPTKSHASSTAPAAPSIVGRWAQLHTCAHLVQAFRAAGLGAMAPLQAAAFWPDRPDSELPSPAEVRARARKLEQGGDLCAGAHAPFRHFHFFSDAGLFGSLDEHLQQVDDGSYQVHGDTLVIGSGRFRYHVTGSDTLTLEPLLNAEQRRQALAHPQDFTDGLWMVSVAYAGSSWHRVPCRGWC